MTIVPNNPNAAAETMDRNKYGEFYPVWSPLYYRVNDEPLESSWMPWYMEKKFHLFVTFSLIGLYQFHGTFYC